ncbi:MAG: hypothetical protein COW42_05545 [Deltaproteobacteria bacterium CG17_big_fil_post_rev_8_21_14_2_50_63_7]|nr:MAG: hypothetical protein COW42_05545 [Deltaproteobacteria bacterium CG17_big_fil_post_rev_8_21_14_2_50_63_7]
MKILRREGLLVVFGALLVLLSACGPTYPECHEDGDCADKNEFCVNAKCSQCRSDGDCADESQVCEGGSCQKIVGYCNPPAFTCPGKQKCRSKRCGPECFEDSVAVDCSPGQMCRNNACVDPPQCTVDADCPAGQICQNERCVSPLMCMAREIYFDFDESAIRSDAKSTIEANASCYKERSDAAVTVTGHCDDRGTEEYNLALGDRRAKSAKKALKGAGIPEKKMKTVSRGEYEPAVGNARSESDYQKNRRVVTEF